MSQFEYLYFSIWVLIFVFSELQQEEFPFCVWISCFQISSFYLGICIKKICSLVFDFWYLYSLSCSSPFVSGYPAFKLVASIWVFLFLQICISVFEFWYLYSPSCSSRSSPFVSGYPAFKSFSSHSGKLALIYIPTRIFRIFMTTTMTIMKMMRMTRKCNADVM